MNASRLTSPSTGEDSSHFRPRLVSTAPAGWLALRGEPAQPLVGLATHHGWGPPCDSRTPREVRPVDNLDGSQT